MKNEDLLPWALVAGAVIVYSLGSGLLEKLGLKESSSGKAIKAQLNSTNNGFSPTFWKGYKYVPETSNTVINAATASNWAKVIGAAVWGPGTDEAKIYGILRSCKCKCDVSRVADAYGVIYKESFIDRLADEFNEAEMAQAIAIVNSLPNTRTK